MDSSANNNIIAATGKRKADDINLAEDIVNGSATTASFIRGNGNQPPYAPQYGAAAAASSFSSASPKKGAANNKKKSKPTDSAKAQARLEANRKAARESRRRKKVLVEELQRSVIFFSRANGQLKQKNEELKRMFIQAQTQIAARNGTAAAPTTTTTAAAAAAAPEGGQEVQEGHQGGGTNNDDLIQTEDGGAVKTNADGVSDAADVNEEENTSADVPQGDTLLATTSEQEQTSTDAQPQQQQQQQQEMTNIPFPGMVQQPIPFTAVPGGAAPAMDPGTMMYMMMMSGNPLANTMMAANPMMALQMFNQLNAAGAIAGGVVPNQQQQGQTTQGVNAAAAAATTAAPAPTAFPAMPVSVGNVIMPTPGGAFNPFGGFPATVAGTTNPEAATAAGTAEGDSPSAAPDVTEEVNV
mmetsp:Transcript_12438/g.19149  ORF Transcript_12438/g.19149 Transcript_12438/m.19149 type:complete len:412 (-) Transcript_12438:1005-2240(-)|eukprot:CAMPEP_0201713754 /NCGR_PEP_ID=MMETSP0593-20130828/479_1 /ASSEMBLY_ACC=CAM_ASM_000672 /TAXON_ID=267983 /ORGANISM="Skeletonema japonicum, Strain CCMP2506" /LENGTH=411 /DNA_ID=CAMNT_0048202935 /DNA_START=35 /DNA_END=1270 /DNA_ORIENTATION=-